MSDIIIKYKKIKNIYIRVKADFNVYVTAPKRVSKEYIYELIEKRKDWIEEKKKELREKNIYDISKKELVSGDEIYYLGRRYILRVLQNRKEDIILDRNIIYMHANLKEKDEFKNIDIRRKHNLLDIWYKKEALKLFEELLKKYCSIMDLEINSFSVKKLKSKWGSCDVSKRHITFNLELMKYPVHSLEYIVVHELAHLIEANHSKRFYNIVSLYIPNWIKEKEILNNFFKNK